MNRSTDAETPQIGPSLDPLRAAIQIVADGDARRVTVQLREVSALLPAARQLARAAGVRVELVDSSVEGSDLVVSPAERTA